MTNTLYQNFSANFSSNGQNNSPFHYTVEEEEDEYMEDFNDEDENGNSPLIFASLQGKEEFARTLVDQGTFVNHQNHNGETALYWAASEGNEPIVDLLIENGANLNICNLDGVTPLHVASANGHCNIIAKLIKNGAYINAQDEEKDTAVHYAVREGKQDVVEFLVRKCFARTDIKNEDQENALELAMCLEPTCMDQTYTTIIKILTNSVNNFTSNHGNCEDMMKKMSIDTKNHRFGGFNLSAQNNPIF